MRGLFLSWLADMCGGKQNPRSGGVVDRASSCDTLAGIITETQTCKELELIFELHSLRNRIGIKDLAVSEPLSRNSEPGISATKNSSIQVILLQGHKPIKITFVGGHL